MKINKTLHSVTSICHNNTKLTEKQYIFKEKTFLCKFVHIYFLDLDHTRIIQHYSAH